MVRARGVNAIQRPSGVGVARAAPQSLRGGASTDEQHGPVVVMQVGKLVDDSKHGVGNFVEIRGSSCGRSNEINEPRQVVELTLLIACLRETIRVQEYLRVRVRSGPPGFLERWDRYQATVR